MGANILYIIYLKTGFTTLILNLFYNFYTPKHDTIHFNVNF